MKTLVLFLAIVFSVAVVEAGPLGNILAKPTVTITVTPPTVKAGEIVTVTWSSTGGSKAVLATATVNGKTTTEKVSVNGTKTFTPTESTAYRIYVKKGFRTVNALSGVDVIK